jgi:hypothetical protein
MRKNGKIPPSFWEMSAALILKPAAEFAAY